MDQDKSKRKNRGAHRKDDDTNRPAVDELVVSLIIFRLIDDFGREVTWGPTHRLRNTEPSLSLNTSARSIETYLEHGEAIDNLGKPKVGDLDVWRVVFRQKDVLHENELPF